jgi:hypothetical protein
MPDRHGIAGSARRNDEACATCHGQARLVTPHGGWSDRSPDCAVCAREATARGLVSGVLAAARALPAPVSWKRSSISARRPRSLDSPPSASATGDPVRSMAPIASQVRPRQQSGHSSCRQKLRAVSNARSIVGVVVSDQLGALYGASGAYVHRRHPRRHQHASGLDHRQVLGLVTDDEDRDLGA